MKALPQALIALGVVALVAAGTRPKVRAKKASADQVQAVLDVWQAHGWPRNEADWVVSLESSWNPHAVNPKTHAVGLIQFLPSTLEALGYTAGWASFAELDATAQIPWIDAFLRGVQGRWKYPGDTYLVLAAPGFIGAVDDTVIYPAGSKEALANKTWQDESGNVTAGSIRRRVT